MKLRFDLRALARLTVSLAGLLAGGCMTAGSARVSVSPPPLPSSSAPLPTLADGDEKLLWQLPEPGRALDPKFLKFTAAREAYWNYDSDTAAKLLRELRQEGTIPAERFHDLMLQAYEGSDRWAEAVRLYAEFGIEQEYARRMKWDQFRAELPPRRLDFERGAPPIPIELRFGDLVIVEALVNGMKARLLLDTGFGVTWVSEKFARRAGMAATTHNITLADVNSSSRQTPLALVRELRLGGLTVTNHPVAIGHLLFVEWFVGVDGVIGWDVLQHGDITWDFPSKVMTITAPEGPVVTEPHLAGRSGPIFVATSAAGRPLLISLDTGAHGNRKPNAIFSPNDGVLATKLPIETFQSTWRPLITMGIHSLNFATQKRATPFSFWMDGYRFDLAFARLQGNVFQQDLNVTLDGVVGNGPFLSGKLRLCGVRRLIAFEPGTAEADKKK